jgi:hypothetical protein
LKITLEEENASDNVIIIQAINSTVKFVIFCFSLDMFQVQMSGWRMAILTEVSWVSSATL